MKKWLVISLIFNLLILISIAHFALSWQGYARPFVYDINNALYEQRNTMFEAMPVRDSSIIFLGNSIIQGANWAELFDNPRIVNRGISGDITEGILGRMKEIVRHRPSKLFISIGTNDIGREIPIEVIIENYQDIIQKVRSSSPNTEIYVQSILPVAVPPGSILSHNNKDILELNKELKEMCKDMDITYLDLHPHFADETGRLRSELTNDNLHLLGNGYLLWKDLIEDYVSQ